jgi:hypothetical protein
MRVPAEIVATGFELPAGYRHVWKLGLIRMDPWRFLAGEAFIAAYARVNLEANAGRLLLPFAARTDGEEVACFEVLPRASEAVEVVVPARGEPRLVAEYATFWDFYRHCVDDLIAAAPQRAQGEAESAGWALLRQRAADAVQRALLVQARA